MQYNADQYYGTILMGKPEVQAAEARKKQEKSRASINSVNIN
jgi:hypothetical protein